MMWWYGIKGLIGKEPKGMECFWKLILFSYNFIAMNMLAQKKFNLTHYDPFIHLTETVTV